MTGRRPEIGEYGRISYAQEAEDLLLFNVFKRQREGFYVDVGAHHPQRFSNTHIFYEYGWHGLNIDAHPDTVALFAAARPRDATVEVAISDTTEPLTFYMFDESAVSSFDEELSKGPRRERFTIVGTRTMTPRPLAAVLDEHLEPGQRIDFMNVDVEGHDLNVLRSNDWTRWRPEFVLVESLLRGGDIARDPHAEFMTARDYDLYCMTPRTLFFRDTSRKQG